MQPRIVARNMAECYLILGGTGFIGRHLVKYLLDNDSSSSIRVVDKVIPALAYLNDDHREAFNDPRVEFVSANLLTQAGLEKAFKNERPFDYVVNCAGETRHGMGESIYYEGIVTLSSSCAKMAAASAVKRFVEISSGCLASDAEKPHRESDPTNPWSAIANCKLLAEENIANTSSLKYTILRPAAVYGIGDKTSISTFVEDAIAPRLVMGAIYKELDESMRLIWSRNLKMNTVHVYDLCRAIRYVIGKDEAEGQIYNVVDSGNTTQGKINDSMGSIFNINISYVDSLVTNFYKLDVDTIIEEINERHSQPWANLCAKHGIDNTPLSSFLHKEGVTNKHLNLDGSKLRRLGFEYEYPELTRELMLEILEDYRRRNLFPK